MAANPAQTRTDLAHRPAPSASKRTQADFSCNDDDDDDPTSSSGSDSSDSDSESDHDAESNSESRTSDRHTDAQGSDVPPSVPGRPRPYIHRMKPDNGLLDRLSAFLPQMKSANEDLQREIEAGRGQDIRLDEVDEGGEGRYIEMNLGLGVLEEKRDGDNSDEEDEKDHANNSTHPQNPETAAPGSQAKETDVLGKLMGNQHHEASAEKPSIQEIN
ncbi:hypothetical protein BDW42DRAFT_162860, partial [Aspergillus taichungensis]